MDRFTGILGVAVAIGIAYAFSRDRKFVNWPRLAWGLLLQIVLALLLLQVPGVKEGFSVFARGVEWFLGFGDKGAEYLFGSLVGGTIEVKVEDKTGVGSLGHILILKILPTILFVSAAMSVLYHLGILQRVVRAMAWLVTWSLRVSGAEALATTANVFMGMTEAPLMIRPYLRGMTESELLVVMVGGFATISGSMMAVYSSLFGVDFEFLLAASLMNAPAALYLSKVYLPERETPSTAGTVNVTFERETVNVVDAAATGAATGMKLALNIGAMLLVFSAGLQLIDDCLGRIFSEGVTLGVVLGWGFAPLAWLMGVPASEAVAVGELLGKKIALNEYFAYSALTEADLGERSTRIATFALCGFANFGSIAIQLGGIGGLVPERRADLARLGVRAMCLGALASFSSAAIAGIILSF